jgi:hypothetical protein
MNSPLDSRLRPGESHSKRGEKRTLHSQLSELYFLPPRDSTGVSKRYLDQVKMGRFFRVELKEMNRFLAELTPSQLKKSVYTCKFEAYSKINNLLTEREMPQLGFEEGHVPDGTWLYKVARYLDRANLCGLFRVSICSVEDGPTNTEKLYQARRHAEKVLLTDSGLGKRLEIKATLDDLQQAYKRLVSRQAEQKNLATYMMLLEKQVEKDKGSVERLLASSSLIVYQTGKEVSVEEALQTRDPEKQQVHDALRLIYATDCVLDRSEAMGTIASRFA